jgi:hypothetical protein
LPRTPKNRLVDFRTTSSLAVQRLQSDGIDDWKDWVADIEAMKITFGFGLESFSISPGSSQYQMGAMRPPINIGAHVVGYD